MVKVVRGNVGEACRQHPHFIVALHGFAQTEHGLGDKTWIPVLRLLPFPSRRAKRSKTACLHDGCPRRRGDIVCHFAAVA